MAAMSSKPRKRDRVLDLVLPKPVERFLRSPSPTSSITSTKETKEHAIANKLNAPAQMAMQPTLPFKEAGQTVWSGMKAFAGSLAGCGTEFGPLKSAIEVFADWVKAFEAEGEAQEEYKSLRTTLDWLFHDLADRFGEGIPSGMRPSIVNLARGLERELLFARLEQYQHVPKGYAGAQKDIDKILRCYRRMQSLLERLALNANVNIWMKVNEQATRYLLDRLSPSHAAWYSSKESEGISRDECTPDTRLEVLERFRVWRDDDNVERIYWLNGMAGTGKTTLSYTLCKQLESENRLAANFFCSRLLSTCRDAHLILPTIAYQLANFSYPFRYALSEILERNPDAHTRKISEQFEKLLVAPMREVRRTLPGNLAIVIEALDECRDTSGVGQILDLLLANTDKLPVKFFLTSRPEPEIRQRMYDRNGERERFELHLHNLDQSLVRDDIRRYLKYSLRRAKVNPKDLETLVEHSDVLFIYAATIVRYVGAYGFSRSASRLQQVLNASTSSEASDAGINPLYSLILDQTINDPGLRKQERNEMLLVLHTVICAQEPMTARTLSAILGLNGEDSVKAAVDPLRSVLNVEQSGEGITTLHKSLSDYLLDPDRAHEFYCDIAKHNQVLAQGCLKVIKNHEPHFNVCSLASSHVFDKDIPNLSKTIKQRIPPHLLYACRYWGIHVELAERSHCVLDEVCDLLSERLLLWIEVLNLTGHLQSDGVGPLSWSTKWQFSRDHQLKLATDAYNFVHTFASSSVSQSTPHLYISALRFWFARNPVSRCYSKYFRYSVPDTQQSILEASSTLPIYVISGGVHDSRFSPDASCGVSGCADGMIYIWHVNTRAIMRSSLKGHKKAVLSVCYSPNGVFIASGSQDQTIRIWSASIGRPVGQPLNGHTGAVYSVSYSPSGGRIVSGSQDWTIRIWNPRTGELVGQPLRGHVGAVYSVSYSPSGDYIASGSQDQTVRIWDLHTRKLVGQPLEGHSGAIHSVSYSISGDYIVSGSRDQTVRIWDARSGDPVGKLMEGHTGAVYSVSYSPDGVFIVSGSEDQTVRVWDAHTGRLIGQPLKGHTGAVHSVSYSLDSAYIVSGSEDRTVRVWDTSRGQLVATPLGDHKAVHSVKCVSGAAHVLSRHIPEALRIWDAKEGRLAESKKNTLATLDDQMVATYRQRSNFLQIRSEYLPCPSCQGCGHQLTGNLILEDVLATSSNEYHRLSKFNHPESPVHDSVPALALSSPLKCSPVTTKSLYCSWAFDKDGWIVTCSSQRLLWVPSHVRDRICHPLDSLSIAAKETLLIEIHSILIGDKWTFCYHKVADQLTQNGASN